jgi:streptogramin lyase
MLITAVLATALATGAAAAEDDHIEGRVTRDGMTEAGVWVIAETDDLPTPYRKIVVTDDDGRFVVPELPDADYALWVRGYGLADSSRTAAEPGDDVDLAVGAAGSAVAAASIYPASHWLSLLEPPGNDAGWTSAMKLGCQLCHQMGSAVTRYRTREAFDLGLQKSSFMHVTADGLGREALLDALADWSARIMEGETPAAPPRPSGVERNLVITQWEWGDGFTYAHDEIATDKRDPTRYPDGPIYGVDLANDRILALDPITHRASMTDVPTVEGFDTPWCSQTYKPASGEAAGGVIPMGFGSLGCPVREGITPFEGAYDNPANPHNPMFDAEGRVWITTQIRREWDADLPSFCAREPGIEGAYHHRQLGWYDPDAPEDGAFELIDTCYGTHHLQFDADGVLWTSGDTEVIGWFDPAKYDAGDPATLADAQGWARVVIDADADGTADTPISGFNYGVIPNPVDGSVWTAQPAGNPGQAHDDRGRLVRYDPASDTFETFVPPAPGAGPRGVDVDSKGIIWASLGGSGHLARFDRSRCAETRGPGDQCPEGWTLYRSPGPTMDVDTEAGALGSDFHYYLFVDQFGTLGLGEDVVVMNGTGSDSLLAFRPETGTFVTIRIPYPLNTFTRGLDGRIDDPDGGWKGRGLWFTNGLDPIHHSEIGRSWVGKVQLRPDPLAH